MSPPETVAMAQAARLRQFVEQVDARLLVLMGAAGGEQNSARSAEIARLQRLRGLALGLLDKGAAAA